MKGQTMDIADWKYETEDSIRARLKTAGEAQTRTRFSIVLMMITSVMMLVSIYNAYFSYDYYWCLEHKDSMFANQRPAAKILEEQALRSWADSRNVLISLFGIRVSVDDAPILGTATLLILSLWLLLSARRENHTIGFLLRDTDSTPTELSADLQLYAQQQRWLIFHDILSNTLLTDFTQSFTPINSLTKEDPTGPKYLDASVHKLHSAIFSMLGIFFFLFPVIVAALVYIIDTNSYFLPDPFEGNQLPIKNLFFWITRVGFFILWIPLMLTCLRAMKYSRATETLLREYYDRVKVDLQKASLKKTVHHHRGESSRWRIPHRHREMQR